jgi:hypothetical protein
MFSVSSLYPRPARSPPASSSSCSTASPRGPARARSTRTAGRGALNLMGDALLVHPAPRLKLQGTGTCACPGHGPGMRTSMWDHRVGDVDERIVRDIHQPVVVQRIKLTIAIWRLVNHCSAVIRDGSMDRAPIWNWLRSSVPFDHGRLAHVVQVERERGRGVAPQLPERDGLRLGEVLPVAVEVDLSWCGALPDVCLGTIWVVHRNHDDGQVLADRPNLRHAAGEVVEDLQCYLGAV